MPGIAISRDNGVMTRDLPRTEAWISNLKTILAGRRVPSHFRRAEVTRRLGLNQAIWIFEQDGLKRPSRSVLGFAY